MARKLPFVLCTSVFVTTLILSGCGSSQMGSSLSGNNSQSGTPPTVSAVAVQVNGVAPNRAQEVQFSEAMDPSTINSQSFQVTDSSGKPATGNVTYDPDFNTASFQPSPALQTGANYTATISTAAASSGGTHLAQPYTFEFTTRATPDTSPISVTSVSPTANATCVSATSPITVTFDEAPDASTVTPGNFMVSGPSGAISVKISTNVTTTQVVLTPTAALPSGTITVTVNNVADLAGVKMAAAYTWSFSTSCSGGGGGGNGGGGGATMQFTAPIFGKTFAYTRSVGQVTVDLTGNVTIQLHGATPGQTLAARFCPIYPDTQTSSSCFSIGAMSTDASGNGNLAVKFPKPGSWAGDFQLVNGPVDQFSADYGDSYGPGYFSTLQPEVDIAGLNAQPHSEPLASGTVTFSSSPAPNGSFQLSITGAPANVWFDFSEGGLALVGDENYVLVNSQGYSYFPTDSQGNLSVTLLPSGEGGDIFVAGDGQQGYYGGFSVPQ